MPAPVVRPILALMIWIAAIRGYENSRVQATP